MKLKLLYLIKMVSKKLFYGFLLQCLFLTTLMAHDIHAQVKPIDKTFVVLAKSEWQLQEIFKNIEKNTDYKFVYPEDILNNKPTINTDKKRQSVNDLLVEIGTVFNLKFKQVNNSIYVGEGSGKKETIQINIEEITVSGKVTDDKGDPLPGASVTVAGTTSGTVTDLDGNYTLNVPDGATLIFSYIGFEASRILVGNRTQIDVALNVDATSLEEVVVVGYGSQRRRDLTGSVASADIEAFRESPNVNIMQSLQGSVPGVQIGQVNQAGAEPSIAIRGQNTLGGSTSPLIVVDGIIFRGRISDLNPADIKSVDVLKDASSKAIYGAQAANGVMLITTKGGGSASKKPTVNYSGSYSSQTPTVKARLLNREETLQKVRNIEYLDSYLAPDYTSPNPDWNYNLSELRPLQLEGIENGTDYDWWGGLTSPGYIKDHLIGISGRMESTNYYISGGLTDQEGFIKNDKFKRATFRINVQTNINNWLTLGANTFGSFSDFSGSYPNINEIANGTSPLVAPWDQTGILVVNPRGDNAVNPFLASEADDRDLDNRISGNFFAIVELPQIKGLSYRFNYSNNLRWWNRANSNIYGAGLTGSAYKEHGSILDALVDNIITYDRLLNDHGINFTLVAGLNTVKYERTFAQGTNIPNLSLSYNSLEQAINPVIQSNAYEEASVYQMGRINYSYKDRYILTATLRRDGYSGFSANNKVAIFPSIGAAWILSDEPFFNVPKIDLFKLRGSYGKNGNQVERYSSLARVSSELSSHYVFGDGAPTSLGQSPSSLANPNLSWESTTGLNLGIDFSIFNNKIRGNFEYYNTTTTDLIWPMNLPRLSGFSSITTNLGKINNTGAEFSIFTNPIETKSFKWDLDIHFSSNRNRIERLLGLDRNGDGREDDLIASGLFIGHSIGTIYDYEIDGIWQVNDDILRGFNPGTYRIVDQDGDGLITAENDRRILGRIEPAFQFGIQNTFQMKDFTLRIFLNSIQGGKDGYLGVNHPFGVNTTRSTAQHGNWFTFYDYWSPNNPGGKYPILWEAAQISPVKYYSRSFVRLQDIALSYRLSNLNVQKLGIGSAKIFISGKNLLTFTNWDGWDPETAQGVSNLNTFPVMKAYSLGIDISF
jgi:TonB-linked SusC/RagA family outer membrane protein